MLRPIDVAASRPRFREIRISDPGPITRSEARKFLPVDVLDPDDEADLKSLATSAAVAIRRVNLKPVLLALAKLYNLGGHPNENGAAVDYYRLRRYVEELVARACAGTAINPERLLELSFPEAADVGKLASAIRAAPAKRRT